MVDTLKVKIRDRIISNYGRLFSREDVASKELEDAINNIIDEMAKQEHVDFSGIDKKKIIQDLLNDFLGFGPIDSLMKDKLVTEIMINGPKKIFVERNGKTQLSDITFKDDKELMYLIHKLLAPTRRRVDESCPYADIALKDGSRVNIIIPPLALDGPMVTIRKFLNIIMKRMLKQ